MATNSIALHTLLTTILGAFKDPHHALTGEGAPDSWTTYGTLPQQVLGLVGQIGDVPGGLEYLSKNDTAKLKATLSNEIALQEKQAEAVLHAQMQLLQTIMSATVEAVSEVAEALATGLEDQEPDSEGDEPSELNSDDGPEEDAPAEGEELPEPAKEDEEPAPAPLGTPQEKDDAEPAGLLQPTHGYGTEGTPSGPATIEPTPDAPHPSDAGPNTFGDPLSNTPGVASVTGPAATVDTPAKAADEDKEDPVSAGVDTGSDKPLEPAAPSTDAVAPEDKPDEAPEPAPAPAPAAEEAAPEGKSEEAAADATPGEASGAPEEGPASAPEADKPAAQHQDTQSVDPAAPVDPTATPEPAGISPGAGALPDAAAGYPGKTEDAPAS